MVRTRPGILDYMFDKDCMIKFESRSTMWTAARKEFLRYAKGPRASKNVYTDYKVWLRQFGGREVNLGLIFDKDEDALAFKLKFAFNG